MYWGLVRLSIVYIDSPPNSKLSRWMLQHYASILKNILNPKQDNIILTKLKPKLKL